jgi:hypothetical protein
MCNLFWYPSLVLIPRSGINSGTLIVQVYHHNHPRIISVVIRHGNNVIFHHIVHKEIKVIPCDLKLRLRFQSSPRLVIGSFPLFILCQKLLIDSSKKISLSTDMIRNGSGRRQHFSMR